MKTDDATKFLYENNFLYIKNFISKEQALDISEQFLNVKSKPDPSARSVQGEASSVYNFIPSLEVLCEKTSMISDIIGEYVLPTYCYTRKYKKHSRLNIHLDRPACEISLSVHLDCKGDKDWPLCIQTPNKDNLAISFEMGDAVLYFGSLAPHWREQYNGEWYNQLFLHYVRSRGSYWSEYFDRLNRY